MPESISRGYGAILARFQCNFLRQHDIASSQPAVGYETKTRHGSAGFIKLQDICAGTVIDAVPFSSGTADHFEMTMLIELIELFGGEPLAKQLPGSPFSRVLKTRRYIKRPQCARPERPSHTKRKSEHGSTADKAWKE